MNEDPGPVSHYFKVQYFIPSILTITKKYVQTLLFFVKRTFSIWSHMKVCCSGLQIKHNLLLRQSHALCFVPVQLKQIFFESISLRSFTFFTDPHWLDLVCHSKHSTERCFFAFFFSLPFYVFDHYLIFFGGFLSVHLLNDSTNFAKYHFSQLSSSVTRSAVILDNLSKDNFI